MYGGEGGRIKSTHIVREALIISIGLPIFQVSYCCLGLGRLKKMYLYLSDLSQIFNLQIGTNNTQITFNDN